MANVIIKSRGNELNSVLVFDTRPGPSFPLPAAVVDMTNKSRSDRDAELTPADLAAWRSVHGPFQYPTIVLVNTGYAAHWPSRSGYFGESAEAPGVRRFPGDSPGSEPILDCTIGYIADTYSDTLLQMLLGETLEHLIFSRRDTKSGKRCWFATTGLLLC